MSLVLKEQQKCLQSFINNATYHPINPNADVTYQTANLFSSDKCFICFRLSTLNLMKFRNQHNTVCTILVSKDKCTRYRWSNDVSVLWNRISATFLRR